MSINTQRVRFLNAVQKEIRGPVVYWMSRDQRARDNWALLFAQEEALKRSSPLVVIFCLVQEFLGATIRQYRFMIEGLKEAEKSLREKNISFVILNGSPKEKISEFVRVNKVSCLIADFDPLRIKREWKNVVSESMPIPFYEVDAHNIVPCWIASQKQEYAAYTFRPRIKCLLPDFLEDFPKIKKHPFSWDKRSKATEWDRILKTLKIDMTVPEVTWVQPGEKEAQKAFNLFLRDGLKNYAPGRNDPTKNAQSNLSPYFHFGHLSAQKVAHDVLYSNISHHSRDAFLEELIVRRELSDNFCFYNPDYDTFSGFPDWARKTLNEHRKDKRFYTYSLKQQENALTHDELWNAAQKEMVVRGKMHGYMRMYWAKKILEWTGSPETALQIAIYLNDKYELDGRDPNGYTGIAWSIGGVHDRAWNERKIFGKIRYMSYNGCKSKFAVDTYIKNMQSLRQVTR
jgi:deoxyribodipyrimidine photo-lyase